MWECPKCNRQFKNKNQSHYCGKAQNIDEYIESQPLEIRPILQTIRKTVQNVAPRATEKILWAMPYFWQGENLVGFSAQKNHIGFFPGERAVAAFAERLRGYKAGKGTIQIPLDKPVDCALIEDIVRWRLEL